LTRPFDKHLDSDELDKLVSPQGTSAPGSEQLSEQDMGEAQRHVESCQACTRKVQVHRSVQGEILRMRAANPSPPTPECIGDAEWLEVAAGLLPEAKARELMRHAAQCGHCGPLLKKAAEVLMDETTPREEASLASLRSARPEWQKNMAETLCGSAGVKNSSRKKQEATRRWRVLFAWPRPAFVLAGIAVTVMAGWLGFRMLRPPSADQLLAKAYTERRTLEIRIPGAKYAPMRVERAAGGSSLDKSPSLLKAESLIADNLRKNPNDPGWLQAKARADLLDGNYESAIKSLQRALETRPDDPSLLTDLGSAYFVRAEAADRAMDYGNAVESLGKALANSPNDPVALFNRALACEKMFLYAQAVEDWEHYLRIEHRGAWSDEVRIRLAEVQEKLRQHKNSHASPLNPKEVSTAIASHSEVLSTIDSRIERYLDVAVKLWIPVAVANGRGSAESSEDARRSLEYLAQILRNNHDDDWLDQLLEGRPSATEKKALRDLLASDAAVHSGHYGQGVELAQSSARLFRLSSNDAGMFRAGFETMLAQALSLNYAGCLDTASAVLPALQQTRYHWLQAAMLIERGQCLGAAAHLEDAIADTQKAFEVVKRYHYPDLELRATAFAAGYLLDTARASSGFEMLNHGLAMFWKSDGADTPGENLYSVMSSFANTNQWPHVEAFTLAEMLVRFPTTNLLDRAVELEFVAGAQQRASDFQSAKRSLKDAAVLLGDLPEAKAVLLRRAEIAVGEAEIKLQTGDAGGALAILIPLREQFEGSHFGQFQADYFKVFGEAYLAIRKDAEAQTLLQCALAVTETGLNSLHQEADKLSWSRLQGEIYRDLLMAKLKSATAAESLSWWEWYKGASVRVVTPGDSTSSEPGISSLRSGLASFSTSHRGTALISYVLLGKSIIAFVLNDGNVTLHELQPPRNLESLILLFLDDCADPSTDLSAIDIENSRLYDILLRPLESDIKGASALRIETDGILDRVPFHLLRRKDDRYLGDQFEVSFSQGVAYEVPVNSASEAISSVSVALIVVAADAMETSLTPLPDAEEEGNEVASHFKNAILIAGSGGSRAEVLRKLRKAQVFHFVGHSVADVNRFGLVLGHDQILSARDLASSRSPSLRLVVLSACETANGSEGTIADVNSVARALVAVRIPQIVASRWNVDSTATRQLMRVFYLHLMAGETTTQALRAASDTIRLWPQYRHPYYWASFAVFES